MGRSTFMLVLIFSVILHTSFAPPVTQQKKENEAKDSEYGGLEDYMEYHRYLKEVVNALESDPDFRKKLDEADENVIRSGKIADELQFVSHHVRTRLDEIKRVELQRLKELVEKKMKLEQQLNTIDDPIHHHLDQSNPHTFEIEDLKKLIVKTTDDLAEADKQRKEDFKQYELEKEYQKIEKLNHTNGSEREKLEQEYKEREQKHKKHEKLHEPGHKAQLEEVWEEQDQMQQDFDPKTFFMLHDVDGNGLWDQEEVKALFIKELDKMYQQGAPEDDMRERIEEMERMRESVFSEIDKNRDGFIDFTEFLQQTKTSEFKQDHGWQGLDEQTRPYTDEELNEYIRQHHAANQIPQYGQVPQYQQVPPGGYQQVPPGYQQVHPNQQQQFYPGQVPQMDLNTNEIHVREQQYQQVPQQQYQNHPNQQPPVPNVVNSQYQQNQQPPVSNVANSQYQPNQQPPVPNVANIQYQQNQQPPVSNVANSQYQPNQQQNQPNQQPHLVHNNIPHPNVNNQPNQQPPNGANQQQQQPPVVKQAK